MFQCLPHTLDQHTEQWRVLDQAHRARNLAEYEGAADIDEQLVAPQRIAREAEKRLEILAAP